MTAPALSILLLSLLAADAPKVPVDADGNPDYQTALNDRLGKGCTPENNANVLLWRSLGPTPEGGKGMPAEYFRCLGIAEPPKDGDYFVDLTAFLLRDVNIDRETIQALSLRQFEATKRAWSRKDYPHLAAWLDANEKPLNVVVEGSKRSEYFNPLLPDKTHKVPDSLFGIMPPNVQPCRGLALALSMRAMQRVGAKEFDAAWRDLLACHRLGRLIARGGTLTESLYGLAINQIATIADLAYLDCADLPAAKVRERLKDLQALPPLPPLADKIDVTERYMFLNSIQLIRRGESGSREELIGGVDEKLTPGERRVWAAKDWGPAVRAGKDWFDRVDAALRKKSRPERLMELDHIKRELRAIGKRIERATRPADPPNAKEMTGEPFVELFGPSQLDLLMPMIRQMQDFYDRAEQVQRNLHIAFALAAYQCETGSYPANLEDLVPKYLPSIPEDLFAEKAIVYRLEGTGYLLYSVGLDGKDEGGRTAGDLTVRMPRPQTREKK